MSLAASRSALPVACVSLGLDDEPVPVLGQSRGRGRQSRASRPLPFAIEPRLRIRRRTRALRSLRFWPVEVDLPRCGSSSAWWR